MCVCLSASEAYTKELDYGMEEAKLQDLQSADSPRTINSVNPHNKATREEQVSLLAFLLQSSLLQSA